MELCKSSHHFVTFTAYEPLTAEIDALDGLRVDLYISPEQTVKFSLALQTSPPLYSLEILLFKQKEALSFWLDTYPTDFKIYNYRNQLKDHVSFSEGAFESIQETFFESSEWVKRDKPYIFDGDRFSPPFYSTHFLHLTHGAMSRFISIYRPVQRTYRENVPMTYESSSGHQKAWWRTSLRKEEVLMTKKT